MWAWIGRMAAKLALWAAQHPDDIKAVVDAAVKAKKAAKP